MLEALREEQDARARVKAADDLRGAQTLVASRWRHADVDDGDVGARGGDLLQQLVAVAGLRDDVHPGVLEEPGDALAEEHRVVRERDAQAAVVDAARAAQRREVVWKPVGYELEDALGLRQAGELVAAEISYRDPRTERPSGRTGAPGRRGRQS